MTSRRQVLLTNTMLMTLAMFVLGQGGCRVSGPGDKPLLTSPYPTRQVFAVAPPRNESGSQALDLYRLADRMIAHLEEVEKVDTIPLNRVIEKMQQMEMNRVVTINEALALRRALQVDGLLIVSVTAYDPYDPPRMGMAVELYHAAVDPLQPVDIRQVSRAATDQDARPYRDPRTGPTQPVTVVSRHFNAADPITAKKLDDYGKQHSVTREDPTQTGILTQRDPIGHRLYRLSMDLYGDFVTFEVVRELMHREAIRLAPPPPSPENSNTPPAS